MWNEATTGEKKSRAFRLKAPATERDDYRDAEPGKIWHELRCGELAHFRLIPHTPYCGTADATPLYLVALHSARRATGDRSLIDRHLPMPRHA